MATSKLSRTFTSICHSQNVMSNTDNLPCPEEAITIKDIIVLRSDLDSPVKWRGVESGKLTRNHSLLSRSPTIKSGIDSLSSLDEVANINNDRAWQEEAGKKKSFNSRRIKARRLIPVIVMVAFPSVYYYAGISQNFSVWAKLDAQNDASFWLDSVALVFFFSAMIASVKVAYPNLRITYMLRVAINRSWACLSVTCSKPAILFFGSRERMKFGRSSSVIWTIGSKPKTERMEEGITEGVQVYSNGDLYEGEFRKGCCSGSGVYYFYRSGRYEGDWVDGKYDGYGVETWARGSRYWGQYQQGFREGYGIYRFYTGDVYSGEWYRGQSHGCGVQTCEDGSRYIGEFQWGVKHGLGFYRFRNGDTYSGEYYADMMHGYGVYQFSNGHLYEGSWHEGKRHGLGMYTFRNGEVQAGYWHVGTLQTSSTLNPPPGASVAVSHTKVLHAVQEARCVAAKAFEVPHVDDRVNKAVACANRAATAARVASAKACTKQNGWNNADSSK